MVQASEKRRWLIAVFGDERTAQEAKRRVCEAGTDPGVVRIGNSLDTLASICGEMGGGAAHVPAAPVPFTREAVRGFTVGTIVGALVGMALALPFAAIDFGDQPLSNRLLMVGAVGLVF